MIRKLLFFGVFAILESGLVWAQNLKVHTIGVFTTNYSSIFYKQ